MGEKIIFRADFRINLSHAEGRELLEKINARDKILYPSINSYLLAAVKAYKQENGSEEERLKKIIREELQVWQQETVHREKYVKKKEENQDDSEKNEELDSDIMGFMKGLV